MKASELRIGNLVGSTSNLDMPIVTLDTNELIKIQTADWEYYGIPITEEWLTRLGFDADNRITVTNIYGGEDWFNIHSVQLNDSIDNPEWGFEFSMNNEEIRKIEFVHQIQNLFFAITGEELTSNTI